VKRDAILTYYQNAGWDYRAWSRDFHMHFGFWKRGIPWWSREEMLKQMNLEVFSRLSLTREQAAEVADLGFGLGASLRQASEHAPSWTLKGLSLVPWQVEQARARNHDRRIQFEQGDYTGCSWEDNSLDGAWCLESACHASGDGKGDLVKEVARILRPGAYWVVADGFTSQAGDANRFYQWILRKSSDFWAMECFPDEDAFLAEVEAAGLEPVSKEDISWRVAPSVLHIPFVTLCYFLVQLVHPRHRMTRQSWRHIAACLLSPWVGLNRKRFSYMLWVIRKPGSS